MIITKQIFFRFTLPLTFLSFEVMNKWWYGVAIDAKDVYMMGFPLIYKSEAFHTSLASQYFLLELSVDLVFYLLMALLVTVIIGQFKSIWIPGILAMIYWIGFGVLLSGFVYSSTVFDDQYVLKRDFEVKIFDSGITLVGHLPTDRSIYEQDIKDWMEQEH